MAALTTNITAVIGKLVSNFELLLNKEYLLRPLAIETIPLMKERIHIDGEASDGSQIGEYANSYMREREKAIVVKFKVVKSSLNHRHLATTHFGYNLFGV